MYSRARKHKGIKISKEELNLSLITDDIIYLENSKESKTQLLEQLRQFHKVDIHKSILCLHIGSQKLENKMPSSSIYNIFKTQNT